MAGHSPLRNDVDPRDVLALDALLSPEELLLRDTVRQLVQDKGILKGKELEEVLDVRKMTDIGVPGEGFSAGG